MVYLPLESNAGDLWTSYHAQIIFTVLRTFPETCGKNLKHSQKHAVKTQLWLPCNKVCITNYCRGISVEHIII